MTNQKAAIVTLSDSRLPGDCSNSDNNLPGVGAGQIMAGDNVKILQAITFTFLDVRLINRSWPRPGASRGLRYWYSNVLLWQWNIIFIRHATQIFSSHVNWAQCSRGESPLQASDHVAVHRNPQTRVHKYRGPPPKRKSYRYLKDLLLYSFPFRHHAGEAILRLLLSTSWFQS